MTEGIAVDLSGTTNADEVLDRFFASTAGVVPDYGGRGLDALVDDLGDVREPVTIVLKAAPAAARAMPEWFGHFLWCLAAQAGPVTFVITD